MRKSCLSLGVWHLIPVKWSGNDGVHRQVRVLMAEADENEDGVIDWREFLPTILPLLKGSRQVDASFFFLRVFIFLAVLCSSICISAGS